MLPWGKKKLMASLGVDEAAWQQFEQEKKAGCARIGIADIITVTENWLHYDTGLDVSLFPLGEIEHFKKDYYPGNSYVASISSAMPSFFMRLMFKNGGKYELACEFEDLDKIADLLKARCPQANKQK